MIQRIHSGNTLMGAVAQMKSFNCLVSEQMKTMEKLLYLQGELERCQEIEQELHALQKETELESIQAEIQEMKKELSNIHCLFELQTEEVIRSYQFRKGAVEEISG